VFHKVESTKDDHSVESHSKGTERSAPEECLGCATETGRFTEALCGACTTFGDTAGSGVKEPAPRKACKNESLRFSLTSDLQMVRFTYSRLNVAGSFHTFASDCLSIPRTADVVSIHVELLPKN
jgi:hypothetical protein